MFAQVRNYLRIGTDLFNKDTEKPEGQQGHWAVTIKRDLYFIDREWLI